jgi:hypothetical protein
MDDWPNSWFYHNPYWKYFRKLADHARRVSFLGAQGEHVADVAMLYPVEEIWARAMPADRLAEESAAAPGLVDRLMREQIDCDLVDTDSLIIAALDGRGRARIGKESYRVLVLPDVRTVSLAAYRRIAELARGGLRVVSVGAAPSHSAENGADDPEVIRISNELFADRALKDENELVSFLRGSFAPDVEVVEGPRASLRYLHRKAADREVYFVVNSENHAAEWAIRFAANGSPERWSPESGDVRTLAAVSSSSGSTTLRLRFLPWEAYYVVFGGPAAAAIPARREASLPDIQVSGPWTFQLAPKELDSVWRADPGETRVELPVMEMRIGGQQAWRRLKIADALNPKQGTARYLSAWDAWWITRYIYDRHFDDGDAYDRHFGDLGGQELHFRKTIEIPFSLSNSWLTVAADERFECSVNGVRVSSGDERAVPVTVERLPLRHGSNTIEITVRGGGYLLAEGEAGGANGEKLSVRSDRGWQVRLPGKDWSAAYEFTYPPFGAWGDPPLRGQRQTLPTTVWYRATAPPGARSMERPAIGGRHEIFIDGRPVRIPAQGDIRLPSGKVLTLRVEARHSNDGLDQPLAFRCRPAPAPLGDWQKLGLDWYSGRGVYRTTFELPKEYTGRKLVLDLGELRYTGEVWLNGKLAGSLAWAPYQAEISSLVVVGRNELVVVAANLLANQMRWNIFDSAIPSKFSRWWHDGSILREADHLRSGLLGPVRVRTAQAPEK